MPSVTISYEEDEIRALIAADMQKRFGLSLRDDQIDPDGHATWGINIESGQIDATKARHVAESS